MPTIILPDAYDQKLKRLVREPFEQTRESIIQELIDAEIERLGKNTAAVGGQLDDVLILNPDSPGSLVHTKVLSAAVNSHQLYRPKWNGVREFLHLLALRKLGSFSSLQAATDARLHPKKYERDGFKYLADGDFSIQGVDAQLCWGQSLKMARMLKVPISLRIAWREKEGAAYPGRTGELEWQPSDGR